MKNKRYLQIIIIFISIISLKLSCHRHDFIQVINKSDYAFYCEINDHDITKLDCQEERTTPTFYSCYDCYLRNVTLQNDTCNLIIYHGFEAGIKVASNGILRLLFFNSDTLKKYENNLCDMYKNMAYKKIEYSYQEVLDSNGIFRISNEQLQW
jgi:hypothetical protein